MTIKKPAITAGFFLRSVRGHGPRTSHASTRKLMLVGNLAALCARVDRFES